MIITLDVYSQLTSCLSKDGIELSRARTNRLIKTLQQFDTNGAEGQSISRAQTFRTLSHKLSGDLGIRSQSSAALSCDVPYIEFKRDDELKGYIQPGVLKADVAGNTTKSRQSMMNEFDSD